MDHFESRGVHANHPACLDNSISDCQQYFDRNRSRAPSCIGSTESLDTPHLLLEFLQSTMGYHGRHISVPVVSNAHEEEVSMTRKQSRRVMARRAIRRIIAGIWALVILVVFFPFVTILVIAWYILSVPFELAYDTAVFSRSVPAVAVEGLWAWFYRNIEEAAFGSRGGITWSPNHRVTQWERHQ